MNEKNQISMMLLRQRFRDAFKLRNTKGDKIEILETYIVKNGDKLLFATKGHIVNLGLIQLINSISMDKSESNGYYNSLFRTWTSKTTYMRVGTGSGSTAYNTTALTSINATAPDSQSASTTNPSNGVFKLNLTSIWNAGTLTAISVSEIGLFGSEIGNLTTMQAFAWNTGSATITVFMFSRISNADGDFTTFVVNTAVPLSITWTLTFTFA